MAHLRDVGFGYDVRWVVVYGIGKHGIESRQDERIVVVNSHVINPCLLVAVAT